ncbi:hypothetical protein CCP3SC1AL1_580012 [Gammaproteobacteria bacterium]
MAILVFPLETSPEIRHIMPDSALYNGHADSNRIEFLNAYGKTIEILNKIAAI